MKREDQVFWDRLADMPWIEAEQECVSRREKLVLERNLLIAECRRLSEHQPRGWKQERQEIGVETHHIDSQLTLLNERVKYLRKAQARVSWVDACKAILDHETYMQIKVHMELQERDVRASMPAPEVRA